MRHPRSQSRGGSGQEAGAVLSDTEAQPHSISLPLLIITRCLQTPGKLRPNLIFPQTKRGHWSSLGEDVLHSVSSRAVAREGPSGLGPHGDAGLFLGL